MQQRERFATLDGFRGIAAIMVFLSHVEGAAPIGSAPIAMPFRAVGGYLAVDLFFVLSGFVLACAYDERLRAGYSTGRFMALRLVRLYPMYFVTALAFWGGFHQLLMIPNLAPGTSLYAPNIPMWSLGLELVANLLYALVIVHLGWRGIGAVLAVSGLLVIARAVGHAGSIDFGAGIEQAHWALVRTLFSFTMGVALFRLRQRRAMRSSDSRRGWLLLILLPLPFLPDPASRAWWDLLCVFALFPALVWLGASWDLPRSRLVKALGDMSYPFYCIHFPLLILAAHAGINITLLLVLLIGGALALDRCFDRPARAWLGALLKRSGARQAATA